MGGPSEGISSTMGHPSKSLSFSLEEVELSELGSLNGRPTLLIKGAINELCVSGVVSAVGFPEFS